jgi:hypothetical protein
MRHRHAVIFSLFLIAALPLPAQASIFGEENGPLLALVAQGSQSLTQAAQTFDQLRQTYDETRRYVGLAEDAVNGFRDFGAYADSVFRNPEAALRGVMPEASQLVDELRAPEQWASGTGELQRLIRVCLGGGDCAAFREAVTAKQVRDSISRTFGTSPVERADLAAVDLEAARAISTSSAAAAESSLSTAQAKALMEKCMSGTSNDAVAACQAAANVGQLMQVAQTATLNEQMAEANRLQALGLAQKNAEAKRRIQEAVERQRMLEAAARDMAPPEFRIEAPAASGAPR